MIERAGKEAALVADISPRGDVGIEEVEELQKELAVRRCHLVSDDSRKLYCTREDTLSSGDGLCGSVSLESMSTGDRRIQSKAACLGV